MPDEDAALAKRCGQAIKSHRKALSWTQEKLAEAADISVNYVSYIERGSKLPSLPLLVHLSRVMHTTVGALLGEEDAAHDWTQQALMLLQALPAETRATVLAMLTTLADSPRSNHAKRKKGSSGSETLPPKSGA